MDCCICIQCYCKPVETLITLNSLEKCDEIKYINLLLFVDKARNNSKFEKKNIELINLLNIYKLNKENLYKSITIYIPDNNLGPYLGCSKCVDIGLTINKYVIFSEDDSIFCKDSISYYKQYIDGIINNTDSQCIGITTQSNYFYSNKINMFNSVKNNIEISNDYFHMVDNIKKQVYDLCLFNKIEKVKWAPNKQFCISKNNWEKIKYFRTNDYIINNKLSKDIAPDTATGKFIEENNFYFYYSIIPRTNDIGLFNELGCTTLYYNSSPSITTIKYITSDNFNNIMIHNYDILYNMQINTII
jgi:hypothetical protein